MATWSPETQSKRPVTQKPTRRMEDGQMGSYWGEKVRAAGTGQAEARVHVWAWRGPAACRRSHVGSLGLDGATLGRPTPGVSAHTYTLGWLGRQEGHGAVRPCCGACLSLGQKRNRSAPSLCCPTALLTLQVEQVGWVLCWRGCLVSFAFRLCI